MLWFYPTILLATLFYLLYKYFTRKFDYWRKQNVFHLKPLPFFGNMLDMLSIRKSLGENIVDMYNAAGDRDFFGIFIFDRPTLMVKSPKLVRTILQKDFSNFTDRTIAQSPKHPVMSNLLFVQRNPVWKEARLKLSPVFTSGKLKLMFPLMMDEAKKMTDYISTCANIPDVEIKEICAKFSTNVIARCIFAVEANCFKDLNAIFRQVGRQMFDFRLSTALRQMGSFFAPALFEQFSINVFHEEVVNSLQDIFSDVLHARIASDILKGNDFVDILLEANRKNGGKDFTEEAMLGQAIMFFAAGFETVSSTMGFTLYELCVNPEIQEKLRDEINTCLKKDTGITYEVLHEMKYLDMCISEALRKYPPVIFLDRTCKNDYKIEDTDVVLEKGMPVYISLQGLHYDPKNFPNPEKYDPERFADKAKINKDGIFYAPFGEGPRICIGQRFGLMEAKIGLISILSKYRLERTEKTPMPINFAVKSFILQSKVGLPLKFVPL